MKPVFISYARRASAAQAKALHQALGDDSFLDERDIEFGEHFPEAIADALLGSRVVVVFADEAYFRRWYCVWELRTALGPAAFAGERLDPKSLQHFVIALPADEKRPAEVDRLPPALAEGNWPRASETEEIANLVRAKVAGTGTSVGHLYTDGGQTVEAVKAQLLQLTANPPPLSLAGLRKYPLEIPPSLKNFVGRSDDLWRIDFALSTLRGETTGAALTASIEGGGGFGKSALAREYLHRFGPKRFLGGIFWINAEGSLDAQFHGILQALIPTVSDFPKFQREKRDARRELAAALDAEAAKASILWIVDNIPDNGAPLREYCPALGKVAVLTTSRRKLSAMDESVNPLPLAVLDIESAVDLLAAGLSPRPPRPDCDSVVEWVGSLPLALVVLNAGLRLKRFTVSDLARTARREGPAKQLDRGMKATGRSGGVERAFGLSYARLSRKGREGARLIARMAPSPIPMQLVQHLGLSDDVRNELVERSFVGDVELGPSDAQSTVPAFGAMHAVLADYLSRRADRACYWRRKAEVIRTVSAVATTLDDAWDARDQWRVLLQCAPHAQHLLRLSHPAAGTVQIPADVRAVLATATSNGAYELGRREEALAAMHEAVEALLPLAKGRPTVFAPSLARCLNNLSNRLSDMGRREEALVASANAVEIHHRLAEAVPNVFEPDLAISLNNLSNRLSDMGRREEALVVIEKAVQIDRRLAEAHPQEFELRLAGSLNNLSNRLSELGRRDEALAPIEEAVTIYRRLAKDRPEAFESDLAGSLDNFSSRLGDLGRREEAFAPVEEAVKIRRRLAKDRPEAFEPDLGTSLNNLSVHLSDLGRREEALAAIKEAVQIRRRLAQDHPEAFEPDLGTSLNILSNHLSDLGRPEEALTAIENAVDVYRRLAKAHPDTFKPVLAMSLNTLSECLTTLGRPEEALTPIEEAVGVFRSLAEATPDAFKPYLAESLKNLSITLGKLSRWDEALAAIELSVEIRRQLVKARPNVFEPELEMSLKNLFNCLVELGRKGEADAAEREATEIRARLAQKNGSS